MYILANGVNVYGSCLIRVCGGRLGDIFDYRIAYVCAGGSSYIMLAWGGRIIDPSLVGCWGAYGAEQNFGSQHRPPSLRGLMAGPKVKGDLGL